MTFDNGKVKADNTSQLLSINFYLPDGSLKTITADQNLSTETNPIVLPHDVTSFDNIMTFIPLGETSIDLNELTSNYYDFARDDDGDSDMSATGNMSIDIEDNQNKTMQLTDHLSACNAPYKIKLTTTDGSLTTKYGIPNSSLFTKAETVYFVTPEITHSYACYAQPNLKFGDDNNSTGNGYNNLYFAGPTQQWDPTKGFKVINADLPSANFPRTGSNNLFFLLTFVGTTAKQVIASTPTTPEKGSGAALVLTAPNGDDGNVVKILLQGPKHPKGGLFEPATFKIYSDPEKTNQIYSFEIIRWFITSKDVVPYNTKDDLTGVATASEYCHSLEGEYEVPYIINYTNSKKNDFGIGGNYTREIDTLGHLFSEWGYTSSTYYSASDWATDSYWSNNPVGDGTTDQYLVTSYIGSIRKEKPSYMGNKVACVSAY